MSSPIAREPNDRTPSLRASDADREHVARLLADAYSEGRLSAQEHSERLEFAYDARTLDQLRPLVADLPVEFAPPTADAVPGARPVQSVRSAMPAASTDAPVVAMFGEAKRSGRWLVRNGLRARALFGSVKLDLTEAVLEQREITIVVDALFGEVILRVPDGVVVHDQGTAIFGSRKASANSGPYSPETPVITVQGLALCGNVEVKRPKRKWLKLG